jgi:hypothetical protein
MNCVCTNINHHSISFAKRTFPIDDIFESYKNKTNNNNKSFFLIFFSCYQKKEKTEKENQTFHNIDDANI